MAILTRRSLLRGLVAAPAIVAAGNIMPVRLWKPALGLGVIWGNGHVVWISPVMDEPRWPKAILTRGELMVPAEFPEFRNHHVRAGWRRIDATGNYDLRPGAGDVPFNGVA
jgi:hypothetical protein